MSIELSSKYTNAKIYTSNPLENAIEQIQELIEQPFMEGTTVRIMPDYHAGKGCVIGTTIKLNGKVVPNLVGVDVGCGVSVSKINEKTIDFAKLDSVIRENVPSGSDLFNAISSMRDVSNFDSEKFYTNGLNNELTNLSLGTLGGGNHFIEVAKDDDNNHYLLVHTGSRYLGAKVAKYHQKKAIENLVKIDVNNLIEKLKSEGRHKEIQNEIAKLKELNPAVPKELAYLEGEAFNEYIHDMKLAQQFAKANRERIAFVIGHHMNWTYTDAFDTIHNYIDTETMTLRKGAVRANKGEQLVIPMNMRDGSLLCVGKGNEDWNNSAPHGAGRLFSRTQAMKNLTMNEFKESMTDVWTTSVTDETLDEAPMAYKPMQEIIDNVGDTVDIIKIIKPVYNFKASDKFVKKGKK